MTNVKFKFYILSPSCLYSLIILFIIVDPLSSLSLYSLALGTSLARHIFIGKSLVPVIFSVIFVCSVGTC